MNEAKALTELCARGSHKNVVYVIRHGALPPYSFFYYFDMEYCEKTLYQHIVEPPFSRCGVPCIDELRSALPIIIDICSGLAYIHEKNYVHRDLNPRNGRSPPIRLLICSSIPETR